LKYEKNKMHFYEYFLSSNPSLNINDIEVRGGRRLHPLMSHTNHLVRYISRVIVIMFKSEKIKRLFNKIST